MDLWHKEKLTKNAKTVQPVVSNIRNNVSTTVFLDNACFQVEKFWIRKKLFSIGWFAT